MTPEERERLRGEIADRLVEMEALFRGPYKLTFVARAPHLADGDVLVTCDDPALVLAAVQRLGTYPPDPAIVGEGEAAALDASPIPPEMVLRDGDARYARGLVRAHRLRSEGWQQPMNVEVLERILWKAGLYSGPVQIEEAREGSVPLDASPTESDRAMGESLAAMLTAKHEFDEPEASSSSLTGSSTPPPQGWQPIETANHGDMLLLYRPKLSARERVAVRRVRDWCGPTCCPNGEPTHWMPLPAPPSESPRDEP